MLFGLTVAQFLASLMAFAGVVSLGTAEEVFTAVVCQKNIATMPTTPINIGSIAVNFYFLGVTSPAAIEEVANYFTTHTHAELAAMYPFP